MSKCIHCSKSLTSPDASTCAYCGRPQHIQPADYVPPAPSHNSNYSSQTGHCAKCLKKLDPPTRNTCVYCGHQNNQSTSPSESPDHTQTPQPSSQARNLHIFTTDLLPENMVIQEMFSMIQYTGSIQTNFSWIKTAKHLVAGKTNENQEILNAFMSYAPPEANCILGVQISNTSQHVDGSTYFYTTYIGTPAIVVKRDELAT